jgi:MFS transporter, CP family, cyanate transporter
VGVNLRTVLLGVPPTLPALHQALSLSYSAGGLLTSLPILLMALGAMPGSYLVSRTGARTAVAIGLALVALGAALRGAFPHPLSLFLFTVLLALGIAVTQPAVPSLAQAWFPSKIGRAIAIYSNGILVGEVIAATITLPLLLVPFGWQAALSAWAVPAAIVLALWLAVAPPSRPVVNAPTPSLRLALLPDWRNGRIWRIGLLMGGASIVYFGMNAWIPDTLDARQAHHLIPLTLGVLNFMQLPVSLWLAWRGDAMLGRRWPYVVAGAAAVLGVAGYTIAPAGTAPIWAGVAGAGSSMAFILNLGLPALLSPSEVARASGFMFTLGYGFAFFGPALGGLAWDWTGEYRLALLPMVIGGFGMLALGATMAGVGVRKAPPVESAVDP